MKWDFHSTIPRFQITSPGVTHLDIIQTATVLVSGPGDR